MPSSTMPLPISLYLASSNNSTWYTESFSVTHNGHTAGGIGKHGKQTLEMLKTSGMTRPLGAVAPGENMKPSP